MAKQYTHDETLRKYSNMFYTVYAVTRAGYHVVHTGTGLVVPPLGAYQPSKASYMAVQYLRDAKALADLCAELPGMDTKKRPTREALSSLKNKLEAMAETRET